MIEYLAPGEEIKSFTPNRPGGTFEPFVERILRAISAGLNLPYEVVAKDFSRTNYSSARAALLEARRYFKVRQEWLARKLCQPVLEMLLEEAYLAGELKAGSFYGKNKTKYWTGASWIAPGWEWVDPLKEAKAAEVGLKNGITTHADLYSAQGKDWEESFEQRKRELDKIKELGLPQGDTNAKEEKEDTKEDDEKED